MPETASLEPFEQPPEQSPAFIQNMSSHEDVLSDSTALQEDAIPESVLSHEDTIPDSTVLQEDAINRVPTPSEPNGGPLGCCLGVVVALLLSLSIAIASRLYADPLAAVLHGGLSITVRLVMALVACVGAIIFGFLGWKIGRRMYREYELSPKQQQRLARLQAKHPQRMQRRR